MKIWFLVIFPLEGKKHGIVQSHQKVGTGKEATKEDSEDDNDNSPLLLYLKASCWDHHNSSAT